MSLVLASSSRLSSCRFQNNASTHRTSHRTFCSENTKKTVPPKPNLSVQHFPVASCITGEGQTVLSSTERSSNLKRTSLSSLSASLPAVKATPSAKVARKKRGDPSADISLINPPLGHRPLKRNAATSAFQQLFTNDHGPSSFGVQFQPDHSPQISMEQYIKAKKQLFFKEQHSGVVYPIKMAPSLTAHLNQPNISYESVFYENGQVQQTSSSSTGTVGMLSMHLKTPGGFWDVFWVSSAENIKLNKNIFFADMVKKIKINWKAPQTSPAIDQPSTTPSLQPATTIPPQQHQPPHEHSRTLQDEVLD